ncbi:hypothetical protein [Cytophaga sp. FL35]|uniref:hypothetical protein n=1 Tax=Cytophaga sp. FL35 TaxID=1904456 RepID=UPI0016535D2D|nr:hypothetical protein [Cytophaga sp. FL35]MBC6998585.1 hypothetical protein [Cytophaga sp. FL35]
MSRNNFDEEIRKKFEARRLTPSAGAWDKIEGQLGSPPAYKPTYYRWGVAAAFIAFLLLSVLYVIEKDNSTLSVEEVVVKPQQELKEKVEVEVADSDVDERTIVKPTFEQVVETSPKKAVKKEEEKPFVFKDEEVIVVVEDVMVKEKVNGDDTNNLLINTKVEELIAQVAILETNKQTLTDAEVDSLLKEAQNEILNSRITESSGSVDAMALLADVETELDKTFRDQLFDALKDRFIKVRTALADRNQ